MLERKKPNIWSKWHAQCESNGGKSTWDSQSWQLNSILIGFLLTILLPSGSQYSPHRHQKPSHTTSSPEAFLTQCRDEYPIQIEQPSKLKCLILFETYNRTQPRKSGTLPQPHTHIFSFFFY